MMTQTNRRRMTRWSRVSVIIRLVGSALTFSRFIVLTPRSNQITLSSKGPMLALSIPNKLFHRQQQVSLLALHIQKNRHPKSAAAMALDG
jgi:hypothetical protein